MVQYSSSQLTDFTGLLYQDSLSHRHLNLRYADGDVDQE